MKIAFLLFLILLFSNKIFSKESINLCIEAYIKNGFIQKMESGKIQSLKVSHFNLTHLSILSQRKINPIEKILKTFKILNFEKVHLREKGINTSEILTFADGMKGLWKPHTTMWHSNYRAEVLAYELDRLINLGIVPPTVGRIINGKVGSVQFFVNSGNRSRLSDSELDKQSFFDFLIQNGDRHSANYLVMQESGAIVSIDNGVSFTGLGKNLRVFSERANEIFRFMRTRKGEEVMRDISALDLDLLVLELEHYLGLDDAIRVIERIFILKNFFIKINQPSHMLYN